MSSFAPRCAFRLLAAGTWRGRRRGGFIFWLGGWLFRRRRTAGRLLTRCRRVLRPRQFSALFQPCLIIFRRIDNERSFHSVMTESAKLTANHFVSAGLDRPKPQRNERAGNCVSRDAHVRQTKIVDHIF